MNRSIDTQRQSAIVLNRQLFMLWFFNRYWIPRHHRPLRECFKRCSDSISFLRHHRPLPCKFFSGELVPSAVESLAVDWSLAGFCYLFESCILGKE
ncbi:hypothetical protein HanIR_Chr14g0710571 [Helianthus annuus]|nr:hypothetical protein HanIR_Chr14g0710571 [Helianthus annuus]